MKLFRHRTRATALALTLLATAAISAQEYRICLGSFIKPENAITLIEKTAQTGNKAVSELARVQGKVFTRVLLGETFVTKEAALKKIESLRKTTLFAGKAGKDLWILASPGIPPASPTVKAPPANAVPPAPDAPTASTTPAASPSPAAAESAESEPVAPAAPTASADSADSADSAVPEKPVAQTTEGFGLVTGFVLDATSGKGLADVRITDDTASAETLSGSDGYFALTVQEGDRIISFDLEGYAIPPFPVEAESKRQSSLPFDGALAHPLLGRTEVSFVLTWETPLADLDLHLISPDGDDIPATNGNRIESVILTPAEGKTYKVGVHNYSGESSLFSSAARLRVYDAAGLAGVLDIPADDTDWPAEPIYDRERNEPNVWIAGEYGPEGFISINEFAQY
ncbi:MAG TPA: SPOR domain-containing protein [Treponemataceae bacterium]|nr:SPOR domain-containing protein [Treponemataceae bacterium]